MTELAALSGNTAPASLESIASGAFRVLVVDDEALYVEAIARALRRKGLDCVLAGTAHEAVEAARGPGTFDVILLDHKLPDDDGIRLIPGLRVAQPTATVVVMTAYETIDNAIQAIRQGAEDYIVKQSKLDPIVQRILELKERKLLRGRAADWESPQGDGLIGRSPSIRGVLQQLEMVSRSPLTTVLLTGETGVGKEVAANCLHRLCAGAEAPFIPIDCVSLPATLIESMLFGHEKGAFTNADRLRLGAFAEAGCGTIFLDEIGEMEISLQAKLLRVLETRKFQRVGSVKEHLVCARVVAATNRDLLELVKLGKFRFDLYQRLAIFPIHIPPLRERAEDVPLLARHFLEFFSKRLQRPHQALAPELGALLQDYDFPGNVRELKNAIERAVILAQDAPIGTHHLPQRIIEHRTAGSTQPEPPGSHVPLDFIPGVDTLETLERKMIRHALSACAGLKADAAKMLGISRFQLSRRLEKYGMQQDDD